MGSVLWLSWQSFGPIIFLKSFGYLVFTGEDMESDCFLITGILLKSRQYIIQGKQCSLFAIRQFYIRRFLRIFPLYYAILALTVLIAMPQVKEAIVWHISYLSNVYFALQGRFYGSAGHLWSLA